MEDTLKYNRSMKPKSLYASDSYIYRRRQWHPTPVLLPGKFHGQRSLVGCSPWGHEQSDTVEWPHFHFSLSCIGEGNGNPLQCFCLENPRDSGAWWAAIYGVAQNRTRLKRPSSSSIYNILKVRKYIWQMDLQSPLKREAGMIILSLPGATSLVSLVLQSGSLSGFPIWTCHLYPYWSNHLSWPALLTRLPLFQVFSFRRYFTSTTESSATVAIVLAVFVAAPNCYRRKQCHAGSADVNSISMSCVLL